MMTILLNLQARQTSVLLEKDWNGKNGFLYFFPKTNNPSDRYFTVCPKSLYLESAGQHNQKISETCFFGLDINFILISNLDSSMYNWKLNTVERRRRMGPFKLCQRNKPQPCVYQPTFLFMFCWCHGCSDPEHTFKYIQTPWREKKLYIFQFYQRHVFLLTFGILRQPGEFFHSDRLLFDTFRTYSTQWIRPLVDGLLEVGVTLFDFRGLSAPLVLAQRRQVTRSSIELVSN